jgi:hypothetical protein
VRTGGKFKKYISRDTHTRGTVRGKGGRGGEGRGGGGEGEGGSQCANISLATRS